jgi:glutamyl-tRNA synthetase
MTEKVVRTRFAPSPTGYLHIGGGRTALYNYLFAKHHGGEFILRIEDTDRERSTDEAVQAILDGMSWLGLTADEGPFFQTKRFDLYNEYVDKLVKEGKAYPAFETPEELTAARDEAIKNKVKYKYNRASLKLNPDEVKQKVKAGEPHCIRFKSPDEGDILIKDLIKGEVRVAASELDDLIIRRTDGSPTYNFTVVVDDALMKITHVIRGDDHLNNTPRQIQLYQALGFDVPQFAHCSMILGSDGKKMSKRHGATGVMSYREMGYLPKALRNYLVRLGWSYEDQEIFTMDEMIKLFDFSRVSSSAAIFDTVKLDWLNGHYIRESEPEDLVTEVRWHLVNQGVSEEALDPKKLLQCIEVSLTKVKTLKEMAEFFLFVFKDVENDQKTIDKVVNETSKPLIKRVYELLQDVPDVSDHDAVKSVFEAVMKEFDVGMGKVANPVRVCLSGQKISPGAFDLLKIFGKEESLQRIKNHL